MLNYYEIGKRGKYYIVNGDELVAIANKYIKRYQGAETVATVYEAREFLERYNNLTIYKIGRYKSYEDSVIDRLDMII